MRNCFICGSSNYKIVQANNDVSLVKCKQCGLIFDNEMKFIESKAADVYQNNTHYDTDYIEKADNGRRERLRLQMMSVIEKYVNPSRDKNFLDVGCSIGDFLDIANQAGFKTYGLDVSAHACELAKFRSHESQIFSGDLIEAKFPSNFFDVINISGVLVHASDPRKLLLEARRVLKPNGFIFVFENSINFFKFDNVIFNFLTGESRNYKYFLNIFTKRTFKKFIKSMPLRIVKMISYGYSDEVIQEQILATTKNTFFIRLLLKLASLTKINKLLGLDRMFYAILSK